MGRQIALGNAPNEGLSLTIDLSKGLRMPTATLSIIGAGNMGTAIAALAAKSGATIQILAPELAAANAAAATVGAIGGRVGDALTGDVVVLAVPHSAVDGLVATYASQLAGKIVVDITNPIDSATFDGLVVPADGSSAQLIAAAVPGARVLKAFNTTFAGTLVSGLVGTNVTTVVVAGDDTAAKDALIGIVADGGLNALDVGSLKRARELEALGFLQIALAASGAVTWAGGFAVVK